MEPAWSYRERFGLRPIINAAGTMTALGASIIGPEARAAMQAIAGEFVDIAELQDHASRGIARHTGAEAGFVTGCSASGIALAIAGAMTGPDLAAIERLPDVSRCPRREVAILTGHLVDYGAPIEQLIRLTGATVVPVGAATEVQPYQLEAALGPATAALLYVVSHHTVQTGMLELGTVVSLCAARGVPVIVDAASEYDFRAFIEAGADALVFSGHKFLGGPTSGIVAGRQTLIASARMQNRGIGRPMKVGKESIAGALAALEAWQHRDHAGIAARERQALALWLAALTGYPGTVRIVADPTGNPIERLEIALPHGHRPSARDFAAALADGDPSIRVRDDEIAAGRIQLDPCNLHPGDAEVVARRLAEVAREVEKALIIRGEDRVSSIRGKGTTEIGFTNPRGQTVIAATGLPGTDHNQRVYVLKCGNCGNEYGANGSDIHLRRCPSCDSGRPGLVIA